MEAVMTVESKAEGVLVVEVEAGDVGAVVDLVAVVKVEACKVVAEWAEEQRAVGWRVEKKAAAVVKVGAALVGAALFYRGI